MNEPIRKEDLINLDLSKLPKGVNYIIDSGRVAAVALTIEYYEHLEKLAIELKNRLYKINKNKSK